MIGETDSFRVELIGLDYYDGVTEGFALRLPNLNRSQSPNSRWLTLGPAYFRLIAWDEDRDERLFVVVSIPKLSFDTILGLLARANDNPSPIWLPKWEFQNALDESKANEIVESAQKEFVSKGVLIRGAQVNSDFISIYELNDSLLDSVSQALREPDDLDRWLAKLESNID